MLTVIMCTRNRAEQLRRVLESASAMRIPPGVTWEFLLVDNGSTDHTAEVVESFTDRLPIRRVWQPEPGLSNARNAGVAEAAGDYILWTDDDVVIDPGWLEAYADAFAAFPEAAVFGGVIEPVYEVEPPTWFRENEDLLSTIVAKRDMGPERRVLPNDPGMTPYGANYALRTAEQKRHLYNPDLGVSPSHKRLGEETVVIEEIRDAGGIAVWVPEARVSHLIPTKRLTLDYVRTYSESAGETWAYLSQYGGSDVMGPHVPQKGRRLMGAPLWIIRKMLQGQFKLWLSRTPTREYLQRTREVARFRGAVRYWVMNRK
jgi:glycosyltransferase involved in cell wall biosynthesis